MLCNQLQLPKKSMYSVVTDDVIIRQMEDAEYWKHRQIGHFVYVKTFQQVLKVNWTSTPRPPQVEGIWDDGL